MIIFECNSFGKCVHDAAIGINFYSHKTFVVKKYLERKLLIGHKYGKKIYVIERFIINVL
jgi:hypothetical protein